MYKLYTPVVHKFVMQRVTRLTLHDVGLWLFIGERDCWYLNKKISFYLNFLCFAVKGRLYYKVLLSHKSF